MKEKSGWELLQLGVGHMRQNKQTCLYTQIYRWGTHLMYSALKLSLSNFSGGKKEKTNLSLPPSDCSNISGMSPVTELILWRHQETLPFLSKTLWYFFFWIHWRSSWSKSAANYMNTMENCWESPNKAADVKWGRRGDKEIKETLYSQMSGITRTWGKMWIKRLLADGL